MFHLKEKPLQHFLSTFLPKERIFCRLFSFCNSVELLIFSLVVKVRHIELTLECQHRQGEEGPNHVTGSHQIFSIFPNARCILVANCGSGSLIAAKFIVHFTKIVYFHRKLHNCVKNKKEMHIISINSSNNPSLNVSQNKQCMFSCL